MNPTHRKIAWSYGGGTQSIAIWLLIEDGRLPMPDIIVMVDTGREATRTWKYNVEHIFPRMLKAGANMHIAPHSLADCDQYDKSGALLIPAFTQDGKLPGFCSGRWKRDVFHKYIRLLYGKEYQWTTWLGMSTDEVERMKPSRLKWIDHQWPLADMPSSAGYGIRMNRIDCKLYIESKGMPPSIKSACYDCPHNSDNEWLDMQEEEPEDFAKAIITDNQIRCNTNPTVLVDKQLFLHRSRKPLAMISFSRTKEDSLFDTCEEGFCWN